jgi:hypothetical protein
MPQPAAHGPVPAQRRGVRPSTAEREAASLRLRQAYVDDRLTLDQYSERLSAVFAADTDIELDEIVADLPEVEGSETEPEPRPAAPPDRQEEQDRPQRGRRALAGPLVWLAIIGGFIVAGVGGIPDQGAIMGGTEISLEQVRESNGEIDVATVMGGAEIDLRNMEPGEEATIDGAAVMGGVNVLVDPGTRVNLGGFAFMGGRDIDEAITRVETAENAPVVNVSVNALMGGVDVSNEPDSDDD